MGKSFWRGILRNNFGKYLWGTDLGNIFGNSSGKFYIKIILKKKNNFDNCYSIPQNYFPKSFLIITTKSCSPKLHFKANSQSYYPKVRFFIAIVQICSKMLLVSKSVSQTCSTKLLPKPVPRNCCPKLFPKHCYKANIPKLLCLKPVPQINCPKLISKTAPESCSPKLLPKIAPKNCILMLVPKIAPKSCDFSNFLFEAAAQNCS